MKAITVNGSEYKLEFSFEAVEHKELVKKMFDIVSGAIFVKSAKDLSKPTSEDMIDGSGNMIAELPHICVTAFYAGLLENNPVPQDEAKTLMKAYMKENKLSFKMLYEELRQCMEDDGFFDLSGLREMSESMNEEMEEKITKIPQDHRKKQTGTK